MLALTQTTGYAILAMSCLRHCGNGLKLARDVAACTGIPLPYLSKILNALHQAGLITGKRGYRGGFALSHPLEQISFDDVARAIEGDDYLPECMLGLGPCLQRADCPGLAFWREERARLLKHLRQTTLADVPNPCTSMSQHKASPHPCLGSREVDRVARRRGPRTRSRS
jgi:Rrf2 family iron-sulfur cluster assembly transcriptional regulator